MNTYESKGGGSLFIGCYNQMLHAGCLKQHVSSFKGFLFLGGLYLTMGSHDTLAFVFIF